MSYSNTQRSQHSDFHTSLFYEAWVGVEIFVQLYNSTVLFQMFKRVSLGYVHTVERTFILSNIIFLKDMLTVN